MILIFDLHGAIPIYSPCMEQFEETMIASFAFMLQHVQEIAWYSHRRRWYHTARSLLVLGYVSGEAKPVQTRAKKLHKKLERGRNPDVLEVPNGSLAGGVSCDSKFVVYTRREGQC